MLWTITIILFILWVVGLVSSYTLGGWIHILLVLAIIVLIFNLMSGRRVHFSRGQPSALPASTSRSCSMNTEKVEGKFDQVAGKIKQSVGEAVGNQKARQCRRRGADQGRRKRNLGQCERCRSRVVDDDLQREATRRKKTLKHRAEGYCTQPSRKGRRHGTKHSKNKHQRKAGQHQSKHND